MVTRSHGKGWRRACRAVYGGDLEERLCPTPRGLGLASINERGGAYSSVQFHTIPVWGSRETQNRQIERANVLWMC